MYLMEKDEAPPEVEAKVDVSSKVDARSVVVEASFPFSRAGKEYLAGSQIEVSEVEAATLERQGFKRVDSL